MKRRITLAIRCFTVSCSIVAASVHAVQPIQVLTVGQLDGPPSSSVSSHPIKHRQHAHHDALANASRSGSQPVDVRKDESGDLIAKFSGDVPESGHSVSNRHGNRNVLSSGVSAGFYRVNSGDTVARIAMAFGQHTTDLMNWNNLTSNPRIQPGQVLRVGPPIEARLRDLAH